MSLTNNPSPQSPTYADTRRAVVAHIDTVEAAFASSHGVLPNIVERPADLHEVSKLTDLERDALRLNTESSGREVSRYHLAHELLLRGLERSDFVRDLPNDVRTKILQGLFGTLGQSNILEVRTGDLSERISALSELIAGGTLSVEHQIKILDAFVQKLNSASDIIKNSKSEIAPSFGEALANSVAAPIMGFQVIMLFEAPGFQGAVNEFTRMMAAR